MTIRLPEIHPTARLVLKLDVREWSPYCLNELIDKARLGWKAAGAIQKKHLDRGVVALSSHLGPRSTWNIPESWPIEVAFMARYNRNARDVDNMIVGLKQTLDAMRRVGWLPDDNPRYISAVHSLPQEQGTGFVLTAWEFPTLF